MTVLQRDFAPVHAHLCSHRCASIVAELVGSKLIHPCTVSALYEQRACFEIFTFSAFATLQPRMLKAAESFRIGIFVSIRGVNLVSEGFVAMRHLDPACHTLSQPAAGPRSERPL